MRCLRPLSAGLILVLGAVPSTASAAGPSAELTKTSYGRAEVRKLIRDVSAEHGIDAKLIDAVVQVESGYDPKAVSRKGAMGLMQLMPATARRLKVANPFDPAENVRGGVKEFTRLVRRYSGDLKLALAAYNAGEGAVARYSGVPPYAETRAYVAKILGIYTGRPYRLAGSYRAAPVRMLRDPGGTTVITNVGAGGSSTSGRRTTFDGGSLKGGFGASR